MTAKALTAAVVALTLAFAVGAGCGWRLGGQRAARMQARGDRAALDQAKAVTQAVVRASQATAAIERGHAERQNHIRTRTQQLVREVPVHVTPSVDLHFELPVGFVRLHDAAAAGLDLSAVPDPAGRADDAASDLAPSFAAGVIIDNYGACHATAEQLSALQDWTQAQSNLADDGGA